MEKHKKNSDRSINYSRFRNVIMYMTLITYLIIGHLCKQLKRELEVREKNRSDQSEWEKNWNDFVIRSCRVWYKNILLTHAIRELSTLMAPKKSIYD